MKKKLINSQLCNMSTYLMYRDRMLTLASNVFKFNNLPEFIDISYLNNTLLYNGSIAFFKDEILGVLALPYSVIGSLDIYGRPTQIMVRAYNGRYFRKLNSDEFVIMYDNTSRRSIYYNICQMAERISLSKRTIDINVVQQRTPRIWKTSNNKKVSVEKLLNEIDGLVENVIAYDSLDIEDMNVVLAPAPYVVDKIDQHLDKEWAEFLSFIGISSLQEVKKERMIKDEMIATQGGTIASRFSRFETREQALKLINQKFNTNITVSYYDGDPSTESEVEENVLDVSFDSDNSR